jgi:hypothetical protein
MMVLDTNASKLAYTSWETINWQHVEFKVKQLQMRIAKAMHYSMHG